MGEREWVEYEVRGARRRRRRMEEQEEGRIVVSIVSRQMGAAQLRLRTQALREAAVTAIGSLPGCPGVGGDRKPLTYLDLEL